MLISKRTFESIMEYQAKQLKVAVQQKNWTDSWDHIRLLHTTMMRKNKQDNLGRDLK